MSFPGVSFLEELFGVRVHHSTHSFSYPTGSGYLPFGYLDIKRLFLYSSPTGYMWRFGAIGPLTFGFLSSQDLQYLLRFRNTSNGQAESFPRGHARSGSMGTSGACRYFGRSTQYNFLAVDDDGVRRPVQRAGQSAWVPDWRYPRNHTVRHHAHFD